MPGLGIGGRLKDLNVGLPIAAGFAAHWAGYFERFGNRADVAVQYESRAAARARHTEIRRSAENRAHCNRMMFAGLGDRKPRAIDTLPPREATVRAHGAHDRHFHCGQSSYLGCRGR